MASVTYRKVGDRWHIRFRKQGKKEITETHPGSIREKTIQDKCIWYREQITLGREDPWSRGNSSGGFSIGTAIDVYIKDGVESGKWKVTGDGKSRTAGTNQQRLGYFMDYTGDIDVNKVDKKSINTFIQKYPGNAYSKKSILSSINTFLRWLYENDYKSEFHQGTLQKATKDKAREIERNVRGITFMELRRLCVGLRYRDRQIQDNKFAAHFESREWAVCILQFVYTLMLRREEIDKVYPVDISNDYTEIKIGNFKESFRPEFIPKGGIKKVPTTSFARNIMKAMDIKEMPDRQPILKRSNDQVYRKLIEAKNIVFPDRRIRLHDLRHGGIMHLRSLGWPESLVSELARHESSEVTTRIYGGIDITELKRTLKRFDR